jgi:hypothetical protein
MEVIGYVFPWSEITKNRVRAKCILVNFEDVFLKRLAPVLNKL